MNCTHCHQPTVEGASFCGNCGTPVPKHPASHEHHESHAHAPSPPDVAQVASNPQQTVTSSTEPIKAPIKPMSTPLKVILITVGIMWGLLSILGVIGVVASIVDPSGGTGDIHSIVKTYSGSD